jgi:hypothetical protein
MVSILCSAGVQVASQLHFEEVETISDLKVSIRLDQNQWLDAHSL